MISARLLVAAAAFITAPAALTAQGNGSPATATVPTSTAAGVYSEDQAARGKTAFEMYCASCHVPSFHTGAQFRMGWFGRSVYDLFKVLKTTMPEDNIGGLSDDEYMRVIAYILKLNGFPAGRDSLRADSTVMRRIRIGSSADSAQSQRR